MSALVVAAALLVPGAARAAPPPKPALTTAIPMKKDGGVYVVPVSVNGAVTVDCIVDSGASDVNIPSRVFEQLLRSGSLGDGDMLGTRTYTLADGSTQRGRVVRIRALKVGGLVVKDVVASVGGAGASALLGQSFLERFSAWSLDNRHHALVLVGTPTAATLPPRPPAPHRQGPDDGGPMVAQTSNGHASHSEDERPSSPAHAAPNEGGLTAQDGGPH
ncbi:MAG: retropepsin-like aspartic protease [Rhizomicrobium sp.]